MQVFLIHGMGRSQLSMAWLAMRLRAAGHTTAMFGYHVSRTPLDRIAGRFAGWTREAVDGASRPRYAVIGHSLGNIITRLASPGLPEGFARFVMLAPPNRPPALARALAANPVYRTLTRDAGQRLADSRFYAELPLPTVETLIVAGQTRAPWLPYRGGPSDGVVGVDETRLPGVRHEIVEAAHTFIMNHPLTLQHVLKFLDGDGGLRRPSLRAKKHSA